MLTIRRTCWSFAAICIFAGCATTQTPNNPALRASTQLDPKAAASTQLDPEAAASTQLDPEAAAHALGERLFIALQKRRFGDAEETFDDRMRTLLPTEKLAAVWNQVTGSQGELVAWKPLPSTQIPSGLVVPYDLTFQRGKLIGQVAVSSSTSPPAVSGLHFLPPR